MEIFAFNWRRDGKRKGTRRAHVIAFYLPPWTPRAQRPPAVVGETLVPAGPPARGAVTGLKASPLSDLGLGGPLPPAHPGRPLPRPELSPQDHSLPPPPTPRSPGQTWPRPSRDPRRRRRVPSRKVPAARTAASAVAMETRPDPPPSPRGGRRRGVGRRPWAPGHRHSNGPRPRIAAGRGRSAARSRERPGA